MHCNTIEENVLKHVTVRVFAFYTFSLSFTSRTQHTPYCLRVNLSVYDVHTHAKDNNNTLAHLSVDVIVMVCCRQTRWVAMPSSYCQECVILQSSVIWVNFFLSTHGHKKHLNINSYSNFQHTHARNKNHNEPFIFSSIILRNPPCMVPELIMQVVSRHKLAVLSLASHSDNT